MAYARAFANAVMLPDGKVFITGNQVSNRSGFFLAAYSTLYRVQLSCSCEVQTQNRSTDPSNWLISF